MLRSSGIAISLVCAMAATSLTGCTTFNTVFGKQMPRATASDPVVEIVCLWQPGEGRDPDGLPCKGFLGQIMFLSRSTATPVICEGAVRVYLFDDQGTLEEQIKPLRQFDFDDGSWQIHLTETAFGPTYNVFIPYVRRGVTDANCSLRVRLKNKQGMQVFSDLTNMSLSGHSRTAGAEAKPISNIDLERQTVEALNGSLRRTTTIPTNQSPSAVNVASTAKPPAQPNAIQLASHEVSETNAKDAAESDRIRRLEAMMEKLLEQKTAANVPVPAPIADPITARTAASGHPTEQTSGSTTSSRRFVIRQSDDAESQRSSPARRPHPLDDDDQDPSRFSHDEDRISTSALDESVEATYLPRSSMNGQRLRRSSQ